MEKPKINTEDVKILVENILDMSLGLSKHLGHTVSFCPLCGKRSCTQFNIETFDHDAGCAYLVAMKLYNDFGMYNDE